LKATKKGLTDVERKQMNS